MKRKLTTDDRVKTITDSIGEGMKAIDRASDIIRQCGFDDQTIASMGLHAGLLLADIRLQAATDEEEENP